MGVLAVDQRIWVIYFYLLNNKTIIMKIKYFIYAIIIASTLMNCSKKVETQTSEQTDFEIKLFKYQNEDNPGVRKIIYRLFTETEKVKFWKTHFKLALQKESYASNEAAVSLIHDLDNMIKPEMFIDGSNANYISKAYFMPLWLKKAETVLDKNQIGELVYANFLDEIKPVTVKPEQIKKQITMLGSGPEIVADCFCHVGETGFSCKRTDIGFPSGVTVKIGICEQAYACNSSNSGCGWFWLSSCDGGHCNFG